MKMVIAVKPAKVAKKGKQFPIKPMAGRVKEGTKSSPRVRTTTRDM